MNDEKIIELYFARSEDAITETDRKYGESCRKTAYNILGSHEDSEECTNDTYMKVWNVIPPQRPAKLGAFVMRILRNIAIDLLRHRSAAKSGGGYSSVGYDEIADCLPSPESVDGTADRNAAKKAIEKFLSTLPRDKKIMFMKRYFYCCTCSEIASDLNTTEGKVKMSLQRMREKLREHLEKEGIGV